MIRPNIPKGVGGGAKRMGKGFGGQLGKNEGSSFTLWGSKGARFRQGPPPPPPPPPLLYIQTNRHIHTYVHTHTHTHTLVMLC